MEKFLLGTFLSYNELDIINKKDVIIAVFFTEFRGGNVVFVTDRIDQLVGKGFRADALRRCTQGHAGSGCEYSSILSGCCPAIHHRAVWKHIFP